MVMVLMQSKGSVLPTYYIFNSFLIINGELRFLTASMVRSFPNSSARKVILHLTHQARGVLSFEEQGSTSNAVVGHCDGRTLSGLSNDVVLLHGTLSNIFSGHVILLLAASCASVRLKATL